MPRVIGKSIVNKVYEKFIDEAVERSDAFGFEVYYKTYSSQFSIKEALNELNDPNTDEILARIGKTKEDVIKRLEQLKKKYYEDAVIFPKACLSFVAELEPFRIHPYKCLNTSSHMYKACDKTKEFLLRPNCILDWSHPYFPEDIVFYKNGYCWFYTTIHEGDIFLCVDNEEEMIFWNSIGIEFFDNFDYYSDTVNRKLCKY